MRIYKIRPSYDKSAKVTEVAGTLADAKKERTALAKRLSVPTGNIEIVCHDLSYGRNVITRY